MIYGKRALSILLALACLLGSLLVPPAYATDAADVTLTAEQRITSDDTPVPPGGVFTYQLTPQTPAAPLPPGSDSGGYTFTMADTDLNAFGSIQFHTAGVYTYTLRCVTDNMPDYTIDRRVYTIEVYVTEEPVASVVYSRDNAKVSALLFEHHYTAHSDHPAGPPRDPDPSGTTSTNTPGSGTSNGAGTSKDGPKGAGPKTGDFSNPTLWIALIAVSGLLLVLILCIGWKKSDRRAERRKGIC